MLFRPLRAHCLARLAASETRAFVRRTPGRFAAHARETFVPFDASAGRPTASPSTQFKETHLEIAAMWATCAFARAVPLPVASRGALSASRRSVRVVRRAPCALSSSGTVRDDRHDALALSVRSGLAPGRGRVLRVAWRPTARRSAATTDSGNVPDWLEDERFNEAVDKAAASGDEEDAAALAMDSDYATGEDIEYDRSFAVWICMAVSAVVYSVPFGFVRWNLSSIAPLVWWQLGLSTAIGTFLAMPLIAAVTLPAAKESLNFPILARVAFGVRGAFLADAGRGLLGFLLFTLITLAGGEAFLSLLSALVNDGIVYDGILANPATFAGALERGLAYLTFWGFQLALANLGSDKRLMYCARAALVATVGLGCVTLFQGVTDAAVHGATGLAPIPPEFWEHAVLTTGVWFTLSAMLPDYARRAVNHGAFVKTQAVWLPILAAAASIAGYSVASSPALVCLPTVVAACLITNSVAASVGPIASVRAVKPMSGKVAAVAVAAMALAAAPLALKWQQVVAAASWSVGVGSLLVAPTIGVIIADYWVTKRRAVDTPELFKVPPPDWAADPEWASRDDTYWYQSGVHARAVASVLVGAAPNLISLWSGLAAMLTKTGQMRLNLYVVNSEYSSLLGAAIAATVYLLTFAVAPTARAIRKPFIAALALVAGIPARITQARATLARKRLERSIQLKQENEAQRWIDDWKAGFKAEPRVCRALRTVSTSEVSRLIDVASRKKEMDAERAMEIAMNKPDVVRARAEMVAAQKAAEEAIRAFEEAQMMADGYARDAAVAAAETLVEESFQQKVRAEMRYESVVHQYTSTIITTTTVVKSTTVSKTDEDAAVEASEAMEVAAAKADAARLAELAAEEERAREREKLELERRRAEDAERKRREMEEAEEKRLAELREMEEAEEKRLAELREMEEAEERRLAELLEMEEAEERRLAELLEREEAEEKRLAELLEREEAEERRLAELRLEAEEKQRELEEAEERRLAELREMEESMEIRTSRNASASASASSSSTTMSTTTTSSTTTSVSGEAGEAEESTKYEYEGVPGYVVPLTLFFLFTVAVVEGLGDIAHL